MARALPALANALRQARMVPSLEVPTWATEQNLAKRGSSQPTLAAVLTKSRARVIPTMAFSGCGDGLVEAMGPAPRTAVFAQGTQRCHLVDMGVPAAKFAHRDPCILRRSQKTCSRRHHVRKRAANRRAGSARHRIATQGIFERHRQRRIGVARKVAGHTTRPAVPGSDASRKVRPAATPHPGYPVPGPPDARGRSSNAIP